MIGSLVPGTFSVETNRPEASHKIATREATCTYRWIAPMRVKRREGGKMSQFSCLVVVLSDCRPCPSGEMRWGFCCTKFGGLFLEDFSGDFLHTKMREIKSGEKVRGKSFLPKLILKTGFQNSLFGFCRSVAAAILGGNVSSLLYPQSTTRITGECFNAPSVHIPRVLLYCKSCE